MDAAGSESDCSYEGNESWDFHIRREIFYPDFRFACVKGERERHSRPQGIYNKICFDDDDDDDDFVSCSVFLCSVEGVSYFVTCRPENGTR
jgi:hypothetical protein